jgi:hypothetical protein
MESRRWSAVEWRSMAERWTWSAIEEWRSATVERVRTQVRTVVRTEPRYNNARLALEPLTGCRYC